MLSPLVLTDDLASPLLPVDALAAVDRLLAEEGARVEQRDEGGVTARLGSRTTFRLWGVFGPGRLRLPLVLEVRAEAAASGSVLRLRMTSDEGGGYLFRSSWAEPAYRERFDQLILRMGRKTAGPVQ